VGEGPSDIGDIQCNAFDWRLRDLLWPEGGSKPGCLLNALLTANGASKSYAGENLLQVVAV